MTRDQPVRRGMADGTITDEMIAAMRAKAGTVLRIDDSRSNEEATAFAIRRFAEGIGDDNPLWTDPGYASTSPYGGVIAPPTWVLCCFSGVQFGWPGLGGFHSQTRLRFRHPVRLGDRIVPEAVYAGFDGPHPSSFAGRAVTDRYRTSYRNQLGEVVTDFDMAVVRYERGPARERSGTRPVKIPHPWTDAELADIEEAILRERCRGAQVRWWDDTCVGDRLDVITKGPLGLTDQIAFVATGAAPIPRLAAHGVALRRYREHPRWAFRDTGTSALEPIYAVHYNESAARNVGVTAPYDVGVQRTCWQVHLLTHWAGDHGWVKEAASEYRSFVYLSDVVRLGGEITGKFVDDDGDAVVSVRTWCENQRGQDVMPGSAVVALPGRDGKRRPAAISAG